MSQTKTQKLASVLLSCLLVLGCVGVAATAVTATSPQQAHAAQTGGWKQSGGKWWYAYQGGGYAKGWARIGSPWYFFDDSGWMFEGWKKQGAQWYYLTPGSGAMATGWNRIGYKWYYFNGSGVMATGWLANGGKWYYLDSSGVMATGWKNLGGKWYYLASSGVMATGWQAVGGKWYYFDKSGVMLTSQWIGNYYVDGSGAMATNTWIGSYYVGSDGKWIPGYTSSLIAGEWHIYALSTTGPSGLVGGDIPHSSACFQAGTGGAWSLRMNDQQSSGYWKFSNSTDDPDYGYTERYRLYADNGQLVWNVSVYAVDDTMIMVLADGSNNYALCLERA